VGGEVSGSQIEQLVDETILLANIIVADPPRLPLVDHVHGFVSRNRSPCCSELAKALLGPHSSFDRSMILLQDVVQILDRSMPAAPVQGSFLFQCGNRRAVEAGLIGVDDAGLRILPVAAWLAALIKSKIPDAELFIVPNAGHYYQAADPAGINQRIAMWLEN